MPNWPAHVKRFLRFPPAASGNAPCRSALELYKLTSVTIAVLDGIVDGLVNVLAPAPIVTADSEISLPCIMSFAPVVIAAAPLNMVPENCVLAPSDAPPTGAQNTLLVVAPLVSVTFAPDTEVSAPLILNMYVPVALSVIPAVPMLAAPLMQYTPGAY